MFGAADFLETGNLLITYVIGVNNNTKPIICIYLLITYVIDMEIYKKEYELAFY